MSTNVAHNPQGAGRHYTVAELVARERAAAVRARATQRVRQPMSEPTRRIAPVGTPAGSESGQQGMHVTELLRREGVDYGESDESAEPPPPALAKTPKDRSRVAMVSRAAVLFGLTVGGMVGLQATVANAPDQSPSPVDSGGAIAAPQQIDPRSSTSEAGAETKQEQGQEPSGGGASPTTSADVVLQDNASGLPAQGPAGGAGAAASAAGGGAADTPAPAPTTTQAPAPTSANQQPDSSAPQQQEQTQQQQEQQDRSAAQQDTREQQQQSSQSEESSSTDGDDGGVLDPVTGVVSGVLDAGTGLLGG